MHTPTPAGNTPAAPFLTSYAAFTRAFEVWETEYRANPSGFFTKEETAALEIATLAEGLAINLIALLRRTEGIDETPQAHPPIPGQYWPAQNGYYAGIVLADDKQSAWHLILPVALEFDLPGMAWGEYGQLIEGAHHRFDGHANTQAMANAGSALAKAALALPGDCYLFSRGEAALCYATLPDQFSKDDWYWTSTQYGEYTAYLQLFLSGLQLSSLKKAKGRCRFVRRLLLESFNPLVVGAA